MQTCGSLLWIFDMIHPLFLLCISSVSEPTSSNDTACELVRNVEYQDPPQDLQNWNVHVNKILRWFECTCYDNHKKKKSITNFLGGETLKIPRKKRQTLGWKERGQGILETMCKSLYVLEYFMKLWIIQCIIGVFQDNGHLWLSLQTHRSSLKKLCKSPTVPAVPSPRKRSFISDVLSPASSQWSLIGDA